MPNSSQLPYLLQLIDDDSPVVKDAVIRELDSFGPSLPAELARLSDPPTAGMKSYVSSLLNDHRQAWLKSEWSSWMEYDNDVDKLEAAFCLIAEFQNGKAYPVKLGILLDKFADEYAARFGYKDVLELARFLFSVKELKGSGNDYNNPRNSDLVNVIETGKGIPISLVCIYMLVAHRLDMHVEGCNLPGHFLARVHYYDMTCFLDCYNGGHIFEEKDLKQTALLSAKDLKEILHAPVGTHTIIQRVLMNLVNAYKKSGDKENSDFMQELLNEMISDDSGFK